MARSRSGQPYRGCYVPARAPAVREKDWQLTVVEAAQRLGWRVYFTWRSVHSPAGFPDLVLCKPPRLIFVELKTERGRLTPAQVEWLEDLTEVEAIDVMLARPSDWPVVEAALKEAL